MMTDYEITTVNEMLKNVDQFSITQISSNVPPIDGYVTKY